MDMHSGFVISQADGRPMYLQIVEQVRQRVASGDWKPGEEIPSIRALAVSTKVSVITVKRAYQELERAGVIVTRQGRGSFVAETPELGTELTAEELDRHLSEAAGLADLLAMSDDELARRLLEKRAGGQRKRA